MKFQSETDGNLMLQGSVIRSALKHFPSTLSEPLAWDGVGDAFIKTLIFM